MLFIPGKAFKHFVIRLTLIRSNPTQTHQLYATTYTQQQKTTSTKKAQLFDHQNTPKNTKTNKQRPRYKKFLEAALQLKIERDESKILGIKRYRLRPNSQSI